MSITDVGKQIGGELKTIGSAGKSALKGVGHVGSALKTPAKAVGGAALGSAATALSPLHKSKANEAVNTAKTLGRAGKMERAKRIHGTGNMGSSDDTLQDMNDEKQASDKKLDNLNKESKERLNNLYSDLLDMHKEASISKKADDGMSAIDAAKAGAGFTGASAALAGGIHGAKQLYRGHKAKKAFNEVKENNPSLDNEKSQEHFEVIKQYAPSVASNPTVLRSYLTRAQRMNLTPHDLVKDLSETQQTIDRQSIGRTMQDAVESGPSSAKSTMQAAEKLENNKEPAQMKFGSLNQKENSSLTVKEASKYDS